ncbi:MAG TPA: hypothetical protein VNK04_05780 [Gemmataceae bacterium]|nr:hypothetical protein [Gemmataceae bacterium]
MMRRFVLAALTAVAALPWTGVTEARAHGDGCCLNLQGGFRLKICAAGFLKAHCEPFPCCPPCGPCGPGVGVAPLAPWYLYWPMEAHYQVPAPTGFPYWPSAMTPPPTWGYTPPPAHGGYRPVSYGGAPSYWYGQ